MASSYLYALGLALIFIGILIIVIALISLTISSSKAAKLHGGGVVIIGFVPIIFGTDQKSLRTVLLLSLALTVILIVLTIIHHLPLK
ncbi:MAG: DUF131 domain-containing protein [Candidatus Bathyarchaeota archaeon]|nr:DUF131 domain-containing protein [Candidatus Bathyarchaeota archaeon]